MSELDQEVIASVFEILLGPTDAIGETRADEQSYQRSKIKCYLVCELVDEIIQEANKKGDGRFSLNRSGEFSHGIVMDLYEVLSNYVSEQKS